MYPRPTNSDKPKKGPPATKELKNVNWFGEEEISKNGDPENTRPRDVETHVTHKSWIKTNTFEG